MFKKSITMESLNRALSDVINELRSNGLMHDTCELNKIDVNLCPMPFLDDGDASGFFVDKQLYEFQRIWGSLIGFEEGHIYIPAKPAWRTDNACTLRDTLRHEYGHAIAFYYPRLVRRSSEFRRVFGTNYDGKYHEEGLDPRDFMTGYAMESPAEDFAETVKVVLRGRMATNISSVAKRKLAFVRSVFREIAAKAKKVA